ncbi:MAG: hypothetical protein ACRD4Q_10955 [Candidatus Acidiferrales bacterium]
MIDELCSDEWRCENCGELLTDDEIEEIEENDLAELCETCAAVRRLAQYRKPAESAPVLPAEPERFYRVTANSLDLAQADSFEEAA